MSATISPLPARRPLQTVFDRSELGRIMDVYGRMVAAGHWRDYAIHHDRDYALFAAFRRASERPQAQVVKRPSLRARGQLYMLVGEAGQVLRRGPELGPVLAPLHRRLLQAVD